MSEQEQDQLPDCEPCPACGDDWDIGPDYTVDTTCITCACGYFGPERSTLADAISAWNEQIISGGK